MPGEAIQIGPFVGGLNTFSDPTAIADNELTVCENFELDLDGSLVSRPPIVYTGVDFPLTSSNSSNVNVLGYFYGPGGVPVLIASDNVSSTYYFNGTSWVLITNTFAASSMVQFDYKAWLLAPYGSTNPGGYWAGPTTSFTAVSDMPKGDVIVAYKERLWVAGGRDALSNPTRLYYSDTLADVSLWPIAPLTAKFVDVGAGDGQSIVNVSVYYNSLVIFRTTSIYAFQFTSDPAAGNQSLLVPNIGLTNRDALVAWENYLYFIYDDKAYEFVNNRANQLNLKVPLEASSRANIVESHAVSVFNNRILFSFWDTTYVFSTRTRTWTTWKSTVHGPLGKTVSAVVDNEYDTVSGAEKAILFSSAAVPAGVSRVARTLRITDATTTDSESFTCTAETKNYNYQASSVYKRLFWWGADAIFRGTVTATAVPVTFNQSVSWSQMLSYTWSYVSAFNWDQPAQPGTDIQTVRSTTGSGSVRKFVKFMKALRFRQIRYRLQFTTSGDITTAPVRLFSLMTYVRAHERVSKTVT